MRAIYRQIMDKSKPNQNNQRKRNDDEKENVTNRVLMVWLTMRTQGRIYVR